MPGPQHLTAAEGQELACERGAAIRRGEHAFDLLASGVGVIHASEQKLGVAHDDAQQVVEVVGHSSGKQPDGLHFLAMKDLFLCGL